MQTKLKKMNKRVLTLMLGLCAAFAALFLNSCGGQASSPVSQSSREKTVDPRFFGTWVRQAGRHNNNLAMISFYPDGKVYMAARNNRSFLEAKGSWFTRANIVEINTKKKLMDHPGMMPVTAVSEFFFGKNEQKAAQKGSSKIVRNVKGFGNQVFIWSDVSDPNIKEVFYRYSAVPTSDFYAAFAWSDNGYAARGAVSR